MQRLSQRTERQESQADSGCLQKKTAHGVRSFSAEFTCRRQCRRFQPAGKKRRAAGGPAALLSFKALFSVVLCFPAGLVAFGQILLFSFGILFHSHGLIKQPCAFQAAQAVIA